MIGVLLKKEIKANYKLFLLIAAVLAMYISIITTMFDPAIGKSLQDLMGTMPEMMAAFGMTLKGSTLIDFLSSYLYGFLLLLFPMLLEIILANRLMARYVDRGAMAYLLASPHGRQKTAATQGVFLLINTALLILFTSVLGAIVCESMFPGELDITAYAKLNIALFLLHFAISGFCFFVSCLSNESKTSLAFGAGVPIAFYLVQMLANMGGKLENLKYATLFSLFSPDKIIAGDEAVLWMNGVLFAIGALFFAAGVVFFSKRDLPL